METSEDEFSTPGAATVKEVRVRGASMSEHISRERSTPSPHSKKEYEAEQEAHQVLSPSGEKTCEQWERV